ncbi:NAD(P)H-dependent glycerol-3-phosphate dehydrogenase [Chengkuizengella axinellae]|uniref:Glycerol-3-phosphate dehydrogenase [NAD(P)+] n=1 Tax=Chengkuizengella axinellae TaxID=3064388 RepID=A0ABT9IWN8_9BACL|nr:NAD(P)H-dependent glycerol-3-phosphate dehydrogenase [Chengkuizengella sp. 2205SS18-9]MDP5273784.1 NAD(P)H-dependent glycerol-3-phosphate dehydrogenase [Chengkuizengella sp. 2205SS18-9]
MSNKKVSVFVAGSWGTALASVLADNGLEVVIWSRNEKQVEEINSNHTNSKYLPDILLSENIRATTSIEEAMHGTTAVIIVAPSSGMREVASKIKPYVNEDHLIVHATKGFEEKSLKRMSQVIAEELTNVDENNITALSGPSHAEEVIQKSPTTIVVSSVNLNIAEKVQDLFINSYFRVYTNPDIIGVEIGAAVKNIIALGGGMSDGLSFGDNAKAALITRGLAEIARLGVSMGANPLTFIGLAGIGDLVATCTSKHSRNWRAGYWLAQGNSLEETLEKMGMVVEGIKTTKAAYELSKIHDIKMPITTELYKVLFNGKEPKFAVEDLMGRVKTHEMEDIAKPSSKKWVE